MQSQASLFYFENHIAMERGVAFASLASITIIAGALAPCVMYWLGTIVLGVGTLHPEDGVAARLRKIYRIAMDIVQSLSVVQIAVARALLKGFLAGASQDIAMRFIISKLSDL